ncbi:hypothetical protein N9D01_02280 [Cyclobacteriaceae bacterium]|nr:hypothetical protein [Cyclobacteriaceae bacterium]
MGEINEEMIINGTYQDANDPVNFVIEEEKSSLRAGTLIIDVSCDEGMGFYFAKPTTFKKPILAIDHVDYYAVDHTPTYFWESASRSLSAALIVHLPSVLGGRSSWAQSLTIKNAINVEQGSIVKEAILKFQRRERDYPHRVSPPING